MTIHRLSAAALGLSAAIFGPSAALAQSTPQPYDAGRGGQLLREFNRQVTPPPAPALSTPLPDEPPPPVIRSGQTVKITRFVIEAQTLSAAELQDAVRDLIGKDATLADLEDAAGRISAVYRRHGTLAQAIVPPQTIEDGVVRIVVVEARLANVEIDAKDGSRLNARLARNYVQVRQPDGQILSLTGMQNAISALNALPGVAAAGSLRAGQTVGQTDVILHLKDQPLISGQVMVDNGSAKANGSSRAGIKAALNNALGVGDSTEVLLLSSLHSRFARSALVLPVGPQGVTTTLSASLMQYKIPASTNIATPDGQSASFGGATTIPLWQNDQASVQLDLSGERRVLRNRVAQTTIADTRVNTTTAGFDAVIRDSLWGGGLTNLKAGLTLGWVDLSRQQDNQLVDELLTKTQGRYIKISGSADRTAPLPLGAELFLSLAGQWTAKNLDSSEQMTLGGPNAVRAYPVSEAQGDKGLQTTLELRRKLGETVQAKLFYDNGFIVQHARGWSGWKTSAGVKNAYWLHGVGTGVSWTPLPWWQLGGVVAHSIGHNPGIAGDGRNAEGSSGPNTRLWLQSQAKF